MGLDMYLTANVYIGAEYHNIKTKCIKYDRNYKFDKGKTPDIFALPTKHISSINYDVGYWRKANQIHGWFVENVQNGVDECKKTYVPKEKLIELKELCEDLLHTKDTKKAQELLPATSGFFFGSTDTNDKYYWEYYWQDLKDTVKFIKIALDYMELYGAGIYYQSSW